MITLSEWNILDLNTKNKLIAECLGSRNIKLTGWFKKQLMGNPPWQEKNLWNSWNVPDYVSQEKTVPLLNFMRGEHDMVGLTCLDGTWECYVADLGDDLDDDDSTYPRGWLHNCENITESVLVAFLKSEGVIEA